MIIENVSQVPAFPFHEGQINIDDDLNGQGNSLYEGFKTCSYELYPDKRVHVMEGA